MVKKEINRNQTLCIEELVRQRPILTEEEMNNFCTYEEIVADAKAQFDEDIKRIWQENDSYSSKQS